MSTLKSYVHNKGRPETSIREGYRAETCLSFCSLNFDENVETRHNRAGRNDDGDPTNTEGLEVFTMTGHPLWTGEAIVIEPETLEKAHRYVLFNCEEIHHKIE